MFSLKLTTLLPPARPGFPDPLGVASDSTKGGFNLIIKPSLCSNSDVGVVLQDKAVGQVTYISTEATKIS